MSFWKKFRCFDNQFKLWTSKWRFISIDSIDSIDSLDGRTLPFWLLVVTTGQSQHCQSACQPNYQFKTKTSKLKLWKYFNIIVRNKVNSTSYPPKVPLRVPLEIAVHLFRSSCLYQLVYLEKLLFPVLSNGFRQAFHQRPSTAAYRLPSSEAWCYYEHTLFHRFLLDEALAVDLFIDHRLNETFRFLVLTELLTCVNRFSFVSKSLSSSYCVNHGVADTHSK